MLEANCASCHNTGAVGAQMLTLDTAADAAEVADGLAIVTGSGYMPPWPPSDEGVELRHSRGLDDEEIDLIARWAEAGAPLDVEGDTELEAPEEPEVDVPDADVVMQMAEPYVGDGTKADDYRCFLMDPGLTEDADDHRVAVHARITRGGPPRAVLPRARRPGRRPPRARCRDGGTGLVLWHGHGHRRRRADRRLGARARARGTSGRGSACPSEPGDMIVTQIHYHYEGILRPDRPS